MTSPDIPHFHHFQANFRANPLGTRVFPRFPSLPSEYASMCARTCMGFENGWKSWKSWKYAGSQALNARKFPGDRSEVAAPGSKWSGETQEPSPKKIINKCAPEKKVGNGRSRSRGFQRIATPTHDAMAHSITHGWGASNLWRSFDLDRPLPTIFACASFRGRGTPLTCSLWTRGGLKSLEPSNPRPLPTHCVQNRVIHTPTPYYH